MMVPHPTFAEEQDMIRRARLRAGGANIHRVENLCAAYHLFAHLIEDGDEHSTKDWLRVEAAMQTYVGSGQLPPLGW